MIENPTEIQSLQKEFSDLSTTLLTAMDNLSGIANPIASAVVQDLSNLTNSLQLLQSKVSANLHTSQRQVQAFVGVGHAVNSTDGLETVLNEVMDSVIALMRAERGLLMLRDEYGKFQIEAARGMDQARLNEDTSSVSQTILRRVAETGESVLKNKTACLNITCARFCVFP